MTLTCSMALCACLRLCGRTQRTVSASGTALLNMKLARNFTAPVQSPITYLSRSETNGWEIYTPRYLVKKHNMDDNKAERGESYFFKEKSNLHSIRQRRGIKVSLSRLSYISRSGKDFPFAATPIFYSKYIFYFVRPRKCDRQVRLWR